MLSTSGCVYEEVAEDGGDGKDGAGGKRSKIVVVDVSDCFDSGKISHNKKKTIIYVINYNSNKRGRNVRNKLLMLSRRIISSGDKK